MKKTTVKQQMYVTGMQLAPRDSSGYPESFTNDKSWQANSNVNIT